VGSQGSSGRISGVYGVDIDRTLRLVWTSAIGSLLILTAVFSVASFLDPNNPHNPGFVIFSGVLFVSALCLYGVGCAARYIARSQRR
jgi:hypothetical protein